MAALLLLLVVVVIGPLLSERPVEPPTSPADPAPAATRATTRATTNEALPDKEWPARDARAAREHHDGDVAGHRRGR
jgi:hypothetical protein